MSDVFTCVSSKLVTISLSWAVNIDDLWPGVVVMIPLERRDSDRRNLLSFKSPRWLTGAGRHHWSHLAVHGPLTVPVPAKPRHN